MASPSPGNLGSVRTLINVDSTIHPSGEPVRADVLPSALAASFLGVKRETLYAYASRGLLTRVPLGEGHRHGYLRADVERLKARADARAGHGAVAAGALRWGEPVLDTAISAISQTGPAYRGYSAVALARAGVSFERAAELLWSGRLPASAPKWRALPTRAGEHRPEPRERAVRGGLQRLLLLVSRLAADQATTGGARAGRGRDGGAEVGGPPEEVRVARRVIARFAGAGVAGEVPVARALLATLGAHRTGRGPEEALGRALVLVADHELNASTFAARVAASAGASLLACLAAAMATVSGDRHGGQCDRVEALLSAASRAGASRSLRTLLRRAEVPPGFGHPLYPDGDPRAGPLLEAARSIS